MSTIPFGCPVDPSVLAGANVIQIQLRAIEKPFYVTDPMKSDAVGQRTLGVNLTQAITTAHAVPQQTTALLFTVVTAATAETVTYTQVIDLSSNFFDADDSPVYVLPFKGVSGLGTTTAGQRIVTINVRDTKAGTPDVFGPSGTAPTPTVVTANFSQVMGNKTGTQDLNGYYEAIVIDLSALKASTTKKFDQVVVQFNLPVGATFVLYKSGIYRSPEDACFIGPSPIVVKDPTGFSFNIAGQSTEIRDQLGYLKGVKNKAADITMKFETPDLDLETYRKLTGARKSTGGKKVSNEYVLTIPATPNVDGFYELSTQIAELNQVVSDKDIFGEITDELGNTVSAGKTQGEVTKGRFRFIQGTTNILRFSAADKGRTVRLRVYYPDVDQRKLSIGNLTRTVYADVYAVISDNTDLDAAGLKVPMYFDNMSLTVSVLSASFDNADNFRLSIDGKGVNAKRIDDAVQIFY